LQLLRKNPQERLGGGKDDANPIKVSKCYLQNIMSLLVWLIA
jgi:hypothetical protein